MGRGMNKMGVDGWGERGGFRLQGHAGSRAPAHTSGRVGIARGPPVHTQGGE
jgi:predicted oxidoreductase